MDFVWIEYKTFLLFSDIDASHPWYKYVPEPDPRLVFVTTTCSPSSPPFQV